MSLEERLERIREGAAERLGEETLEALHRGTRKLRESGLARRVLREGDRAPEFALPDQEGRTVRSADLRSGGWLVLTFFRGHW